MTIAKQDVHNPAGKRRVGAGARLDVYIRLPGRRCPIGVDDDQLRATMDDLPDDDRKAFDAWQIVIQNCDQGLTDLNLQEVERLWADNTKAKNLLNWSPEYGGQEGFCVGLQETIDWFVQPKNLSAYKVGQYTL